MVTHEAGTAFKAEAVSATDQMIHPDIIITRPDTRGSGLGSKSLRSLCRHLLSASHPVCLPADADNQRTITFYGNVGFSPVALYNIARYQPAIIKPETRKRRLSSQSVKL